MSSKLIVALDVENIEIAENLVNSLITYAHIYKIGSYLFTAKGPEVIKMIYQKKGKVFLDLKYHDIPSTVANAVRAATKHRIWGMTVHTTGGFDMLKAAVKAAHDTAKELEIERPLILGVTVLTSLKEKDLDEIGINREVEKQVKRLAIMAKNAGLDGVVASAREIELVRKNCGDDFIIATPGIRPKDAACDDQKRVLTAQEAIAKGSNYLIVGRPITKASDPVEATKKLLGEIQ
ncbi:MAG: orotidine-5'-phosphate decarboxylase [bacterium]